RPIYGAPREPLARALTVPVVLHGRRHEPGILPRTRTVLAARRVLVPPRRHRGGARARPGRPRVLGERSPGGGAGASAGVGGARARSSGRRGGRARAELRRPGARGEALSGAPIRRSGRSAPISARNVSR